MKSIRQKKISRLVQQELGEIFSRESSFFGLTGMVTIAEVEVTPDLGIAQVYVSVYNTDTPDEDMDRIRSHAGEIRGRLGNRLKNSLRHIPELQFALDGTLDKVFRLEEIFKDIKKVDDAPKDEDK